MLPPVCSNSVEVTKFSTHWVIEVGRTIALLARLKLIVKTLNTVKSFINDSSNKKPIPSISNGFHPHVRPSRNGHSRYLQPYNNSNVKH